MFIHYTIYTMFKIYYVYIKNKKGKVFISKYQKRTFHFFPKNKQYKLRKMKNDETGFDNYHKIAVRDHVHVPKFWHT